jgi:hypothetical protein
MAQQLRLLRLLGLLQALLLHAPQGQVQGPLESRCCGEHAA